ncbi:hepatic and glial cell adhesion molecule-like [Cetorhinus maximus]
MKFSDSLHVHIFKLASEPVSQPVIVILGNCVSSPNITLSCSVSKGTNVVIHWEKVSLSGVLNGAHDGTKLVIDCETEEEQRAYRCMAENPVSIATSNQVTVSLYNKINSNGKRNSLMVLVPALMSVLVLTIACLWKTPHTKKCSRSCRSY